MAIIQGRFFFLINPGRINNSEARVPQLRYFSKLYHSYWKIIQAKADFSDADYCSRPFHTFFTKYIFTITNF